MFRHRPFFPFPLPSAGCRSRLSESVIASYTQAKGVIYVLESSVTQWIIGYKALFINIF